MLLLSVAQIVLPNALIAWGEQYVTAGLAAVLFATVPFFVAIFAHLAIPGDRLNVWKLSGIPISFIGVMIIFSRELVLANTSFWGGLALISGAGSSASAFVVGKRHSKSIDPVANVTVQIGVAASLLMAGWSILEPKMPVSFSLGSLLAVLYLAVAGSAFSYVALYWLFARMQITRVSLSTFITPLVAMLLGWIILDEKVGPNLLCGGSLILLGVVLVNRVPKARRNIQLSAGNGRRLAPHKCQKDPRRCWRSVC